MALGCKVHDSPRLAAFQQASHQAAVGNITVHKLVPPLVCNGFQVAQIPRVGELVQVDNRSRIPFHPLQDEVRSDKTCPTSDEDRVFHISGTCLEFNSTDRSPHLCPRTNIQL